MLPGGRELIVPARTVAIGIDAGGTKIAAGLVDRERGELIARRTVPTLPERGGRAVLDDVLGLARELAGIAKSEGLALDGMGLGVAELVDLEGRLRSSNLIAWEALPVQEELSAIAPAVVDADVRAAALGEARYGAGRAFSLFAYVSVGTGISSCLVQDGRPFAGARGNALVLASAPLTVPLGETGEWTAHILEDYASGPAIARRYRELTGQPVQRAEIVFERAETGDEIAADIIASAGVALGNSVGFMVNLLDPEAVIVGGGLGLAGGVFWDRFESSTRAHIWSDATRAIPILPAGLGEDAGLIGAAALRPARIREALTTPRSRR